MSDHLFRMGRSEAVRVGFSCALLGLLLDIAIIMPASQLYALE